MKNRDNFILIWELKLCKIFKKFSADFSIRNSAKMCARNILERHAKSLNVCPLFSSQLDHVTGNAWLQLFVYISGSKGWLGIFFCLCLFIFISVLVESRQIWIRIFDDFPAKCKENQLVNLSTKIHEYLHAQPPLIPLSKEKEEECFWVRIPGIFHLPADLFWGGGNFLIEKCS